VSNNQPTIQADQAPYRHPCPARPPQQSTHVWPGKRRLASCAVLCLMLVIAPTACGSNPAPSSTPKNKVVFDQTVSANLVTSDFTLTSSHQTLAWSCDPSAVQGTGLVLIYIGAAGSDPTTAQEIVKATCNSGTDPLDIPPGSYFLRFLPDGTWHFTLTDIDYSASVATAIARNPDAMVTPTPTPPPFSPSVSYQTAWGTHAAIATYSMTLDATHTFIPSAISPDGTMLLGNERIALSSPTLSVTFQGGYYDLATRHFTAIGVSDGGDPVQCCATDGRFLIASDQTEPGAPFGSDGIRYWVYDRQTGRLRQVGKTGAPLDVIAVTNGLLITSSTVINLVTGTASPLSGATPGYGDVAYSWPYLVYAGRSGDGTVSAYRLRNLATNQDTPLLSLEAFNSSYTPKPDVNGPIAYTIAGDTLIAAVPPNQTATLTNPNGGSGTTTFYALEHVLSGGTQVTELGSFTSEGGITSDGSEDSVGYTVANNTLYVSVLTGQVTDQSGNVLDTGWTTLYAIGQVASGGTAAQEVGTFNGDALDIVGANARVIACAGGVWDAALHQPDGLPVLWDLASQTFVTFPSFPGNNFGFLVNLAGTDLAVAQSNGTTETVLFFATSTLPATSTVD
jgi:hypothetical protein